VFQINLVDGKYYMLTNVNSLLSLEIQDGLIANEARLVQGTYAKNPHQQFIIESAGTGVYNVKPRLNDKFCVDVGFASNDDGAFLQLWNTCNLANQKFTIQAVL
ncbi:MAG: hypothetical protein EOP04_27780, partial [Proteobacteria bacterium]